MISQRATKASVTKDGIPHYFQWGLLPEHIDPSKMLDCCVQALENLNFYTIYMTYSTALWPRFTKGLHVLKGHFCVQTASAV